MAQRNIASVVNVFYVIGDNLSVLVEKDCAMGCFQGLCWLYRNSK